MLTQFSAISVAYRSWLALWSGLAVLASVWTVAVAQSTSQRTSGLPSLSAVQTTPSRVTQVSGFTVEAVDAVANGLYIDVVVTVEGRPEAGDDLLFLPGPTLTWPSGEKSRLLSGSADGRVISLRFDRGSQAAAHRGDQLLLTLYDLAPRGAGQQPAAVPMLPAQLKVVLRDATNGRSVPLAGRMSLGDGSAVLDRAQIDGAWVRVVGHFEGLALSDVAALSLRQSSMVDASGLAIAPVATRSGYGTDGTGFHLDFLAGGQQPASFVLAVSLSPGHIGLTTEALRSTLSSPRQLVIDLERGQSQ